MNPAPRNIGDALKRLYAIRNELRAQFTDLNFTLDGNLVGDIGEAIALADFGLTILPRGTKGHDFRAPDGRLVQIKATQHTRSGKSVGLGLSKQSFNHLLVLQILEDGTYRILFDGPGTFIDEKRAHKTSASLSVGQLAKLNSLVAVKDRLIKS